VDRLKGVGSFVIVLVLLLLAMRVVHLGVPIFYPKVLAGPFSLTGFDEVEEYSGFSPYLPFYRPEHLGVTPGNITVTRRPYPRVVVFWHAEHFLYLAEQQGGQRSPQRMREAPLPGHPEASWWREGDTQMVVLQRDGVWIELRTDLSLRDVQRIVDTLRPYEELL